MVKKTKAIKKQIRSEIFKTLNQIFLTGIILIVYVANSFFNRHGKLSW